MIYFTKKAHSRQYPYKDRLFLVVSDESPAKRHCAALDNRMIYVPNGMLSGNAVINYSKQEMRRVEWVFGVEYGEDVQRVRTVLQRIIYADKRILDTPAPIIVLGSLSASSVDITVRVWVKTADYWNVLYDINEIVYTTFNKEGIGFPFPQLTVHQSSK